MVIWQPGFNGRGGHLLQVKLSRIHLPMNAIELASLMCSRLCHDLMSPVGALNNGIELLAESARASANKLKFFRLAFGAGGGFGDEIDTREARHRA